MEQVNENNNRGAVQAAIVSGAEESSVVLEDDDSSLESNNDEIDRHLSHQDELYGENIDQEDEAWVYKHMRGGVQETVSIRKQPPTDDSKSSNQVTQKIKVLKPRNSDAVLSCPCCFNTVCMDCQQHERYENQYRAMFVMNIGVNWDQQYIYSERHEKLMPKASVQEDEEQRHNYIVDPNHRPCEELYYSVYCNNCQTQVAALNMDDEVYHFFGCLASA